MAEEKQLQSLLDRINEEGVKKADTDREKIIAEAKAEAERQLQAAREKAEQIVAEADREAAMLVEKGRESLRHAARDTMLSLRQQLEQRVRETVRACVSESADEDAMAQIIVDLAETYVKSGKDVADVEVLLNESQQQAVEKIVKSKLGDNFKANVDFAPVSSVEAGFKIVFKGEDVVYDFTDEALADVFCVFLNPRLAELIKE